MKAKQPRKKEQEKKKDDVKKQKSPVSPIPPYPKNKPPTYKLHGQFPKLETDIDELLRYVYEKKKIRVSKAAKHFKTKPEIIEEWGKILEDNGFIELHYPMFGKPFLQVPTPKTHREHVRKKKEKKHASGTPGKAKKIAINIAIIVSGILVIYFLLNRTAFQNLHSGFSILSQNTLLLIIVGAGIPGVIALAIVSKKRGHKESKKTKKPKHEKKKKQKEAPSPTDKKEIEKFLKSIEKQYKQGIISKDLYEKMKNNAKERIKRRS